MKIELSSDNNPLEAWVQPRLRTGVYVNVYENSREQRPRWRFWCGDPVNSRGEADDRAQMAASFYDPSDHRRIAVLRIKQIKVDDPHTLC